MSIGDKLRVALQQAFLEEFKIEIPLEGIQLSPTRKDFEGSHTFVTFPFQAQLGKNPQTIGQTLGYFLKYATNIVEDYNVVGGFLNVTVKNRVWLDYLVAMDPEGEGQAPHKTDVRKKIVIEFPSPNTNKPLHVGHLRNMFLGGAVAEILKAVGHTVYKVNLINDRGIHICKSMVAYQQFSQAETPASAGLKGDHLVGKYYVLFDKIYKEQVKELTEQLGDKTRAEQEAPILKAAHRMLEQWERGDESVMALWGTMNGWVYEGFEQTFKTVGITLDKNYYESETYLLGKDIVAEGLEEKVFYKKEDGSVWIDLSEYGLGEKLFLRSNGTSVYITQDTGTADLRYRDYAFDQCIYVTGSEQDYHFNVLFKTLKALGRSYADNMIHLSYGMVDLPQGKMKSREGTVVDADNLVEEMFETAKKHTQALGKIDELTPVEAEKLYHTLGLGALKYFLLKIEPKKRVMFDPNKSIDFQGDTGPFIQYTHARICSLLQKATERGFAFEPLSVQQTSYLMRPVEREVVIQLYRYSQCLQETAATYAPSIMAQYVLDLAKKYNKMYADARILQENNELQRTLRLYISARVAKTIRQVMGLLGIVVPERM